MQAKFIDNLDSIQKTTGSNVGLLLHPVLERMPLPMRTYDDPFLPFTKGVINATRDIVCVYMFDLASYLNIGAAGAIALERSIAYTGKDNLKILHGPFSAGYSKLMEENAFNADALTLVQGQDLHPYLYRSDRNAYVMRDSRLPGDKPIEDSYISSENVLLTRTGDNTSLEIWLADPSILYRSSQNDFAEVIRQQLLEFRARVHQQ